MANYLRCTALVSALLVHCAAHGVDERGMAAQLGPAAWASCARHLSQPAAKIYELSQIRSNSMPLSPFAGPTR